MQKRTSEKSEITAMTSCCIVVCVWSACVYLFKISDCDMQAVARSSELWPKEKRSIWMVVFLLWPKPSTASTLHPGVFYSVSSHSSTFTSLCPKPHSWPNMAWSHQSEAFRYFSDGSREEEEAHFALDSLWMEETPNRRHQSSVRNEPSVLRLVWSHRARSFTAKSLSRTDVTSAG